jgi:autotransporter-associated beta strand protein
MRHHFVMRRRNMALLLSTAVLPVAASAQTAQTIRVVTYNTQGDVSSPTPSGVIPYISTVLEGIGQEKYVGDSVLQLPDVIALQETTSNGTTVAPIVNTLNSYYGSDIFAYSTYQATTSDGVTDGGGPNALIYNQDAVNLIASVGVGTPESGTNGEFRQVVRYEFQPVADEGTSTGIFYVYGSHHKSGSASTKDDGSTDGALRNGEAQIIRNDEAANLPANAAVLYVGDYNGDGSTEAAYQTITAPDSPSGVNQGQGVDPLNPTDNYNLTWGSSDVGILTEKDTSLEYRDDLQVMTTNVYTGSPGTLDYIANSLHAFGNNGTTSYETSINSTSNTALNDIVGNGPLTPSEVFSAENANLGSDHLPVVADYSILLGATWASGSGSWSSAANWAVSSIGSQAGEAVNFVNSNSAAATVTLDGNWTIGAINFNSTNGYTLSPGTGGTLTLNNGSGSAAINVASGNHGITAPIALASSAVIDVSGAGNSIAISGAISGTGGLTLTGSGTAAFSGANSYSGATAVNSGELQINSAAALSPSTSLTIGTAISSAKVALLAKLGTVSATSLTINNGSLELADDTLLLNYGNAVDPAAAIQSYLANGYNGGAWNGPGITSATVGYDNGFQSALIYAIGYADGADGITAVPSGEIEIMPTLAGDAKLQGNVVFGDFQLLSQYFGQTGTTWDEGNFTYGSTTNFGDFQLLSQNFGQSSSGLTAGEVASLNGFAAQFGEAMEPNGGGFALVSVPEPASAGLFMFAGATMLARRRRRKITVQPIPCRSSSITT